MTEEAKMDGLRECECGNRDIAFSRAFDAVTCLGCGRRGPAWEIRNNVRFPLTEAEAIAEWNAPSKGGDDALGLLRRVVALEGGSWHTERYAHEKDELYREIDAFLQEQSR